MKLNTIRYAIEAYVFKLPVNTTYLYVTFMQRLHAGPTLYKCYRNILCSLGIQQMTNAGAKPRKHLVCI